MSGRLTVREIGALLGSAEPDTIPALIDRFSEDTRAGVARAVAAARARLDRYLNETKRLEALSTLERELHDRGYSLVAGVDEVGRGALAGPVTAAAVVLHRETRIPLLDDSKRLTPQQRQGVSSRVRALAAGVSVAHVDAADIDRLGIASATALAMRHALAGLGLTVDHAVIDGSPVDLGVPSTALPKADARVACVAAASVVAKVDRDALMVELEAVHPGYGFHIHKGYGTSEHLDAIVRLGTSPVHRRSFAPCSDAPRLF